jgi:hypothetical protein
MVVKECHLHSGMHRRSDDDSIQQQAACRLDCMPEGDEAAIPKLIVPQCMDYVDGYNSVARICITSGLSHYCIEYGHQQGLHSVYN